MDRHPLGSRPPKLGRFLLSVLLRRDATPDFLETLDELYRVRAQDHVDVYLDALPPELVLQPMNDQQRYASYPSNVWLQQLRFGGDEELKKEWANGTSAS